jgi:flagellar hook-associated protein 3 FlgL
MRVDPNFTSNLAGSLNQTQSNLQQLTAQLSSGVRVNSLSDDPVASGQNVVLLNQIQQDDSFTSSSTLVSGQLQVADSALGNVVTELTTAISLATSANNGTMNASNVKSIANQISGILAEVTSLANTSYQGQYIFSGSQNSTAPFTTSTDTSPAVTTYNGDSGTNYIKTPAGQSIQLNVPGNEIFLGGGTDSQGNNMSSVFTALNNLIADYSSGDVNTSQAVADTEALNTALNFVSQQRVTIDNSINQLSTASSAVTSQKTQLLAAQNDLIQSDTASVATKLSLAETQQTALISVIAQLNSSAHSLFNKI